MRNLKKGCTARAGIGSIAEISGAYAAPGPPGAVIRQSRTTGPVAQVPPCYFLCIGMIHQHYKLVDVFTATENIVLGLEESGKLDIKAAEGRVCRARRGLPLWGCPPHALPGPSFGKAERLARWHK